MRDSKKTIGATNLSTVERSKNDYYGTDPKSTEALLKLERFQHNIWEPAAGKHKLSDVLKAAGYEVRTTDLVDYGNGDELLDFLSCEEEWEGDIVTNPPYKFAMEFVLKALSLVKEGHKVAMFVRLLFLEGISRYESLYKDFPPKTVYVFVNRQVSDRDDDFSKGSSVAYAWLVWEKGYKGDPAVKWIRTDTR